MQLEPNSEPEASWPPEEDNCRKPVVIRPNWLTHARKAALRHWNPQELPPPTVDPALSELTAVERSAEVIRHTVSSFEYWLSPKGALREWMRFNCRIAAFLAVPALLVVPLVTFALRQIQSWIKLIADTTSNLILFPLSALMVVCLIWALFQVARSITRRQQHHRQPPYYQ